MILVLQASIPYFWDLTSILLQHIAFPSGILSMDSSSNSSDDEQRTEKSNELSQSDEEIERKEDSSDKEIIENVLIEEDSHFSLRMIFNLLTNLEKAFKDYQYNHGLHLYSHPDHIHRFKGGKPRRRGKSPRKSQQCG